jgi:hypothetical protein
VVGSIHRDEVDFSGPTPKFSHSSTTVGISRSSAKLNGKVVVSRGESVQREHDAEDELLLVMRGRFRKEFLPRHLRLEDGEFLVVSTTVEPRPVADEEVQDLLFKTLGNPIRAVDGMRGRFEWSSGFEPLECAVARERKGQGWPYSILYLPKISFFWR